MFRHIEVSSRVPISTETIPQNRVSDTSGLPGVNELKNHPLFVTNNLKKKNEQNRNFQRWPAGASFNVLQYLQNPSPSPLYYPQQLPPTPPAPPHC